VLQKRAQSIIDPNMVMRESSLFKYIVLPNMPAFVRIFIQQIIVNIYLVIENADILHSPASIGNVFPLRPQFLFFHNSSTFVIDRFMTGRSKLATCVSNYLIKLSVKRSKIIATTTKTTGEELKKFIGDHITYISIGDIGEDFRLIDVSRPTDRLVSLEGHKYVLYVSNFYKCKNQELLIRYAKLSNYQIVLVGAPCDQQYYGQCVMESQNEHNVKIYADATKAEIAWLYAHAKIYVCPSLYESFALTPLEALQFDVPIILSDMPVFHEVYGDEFKYFDAHNVSSLIAAINSVDDNYVSLCNNSYLINKYSWKNFAQNNLSIYKLMISDPGTISNRK